MVSADYKRQYTAAEPWTSFSFEVDLKFILVYFIQCLASIVYEIEQYNIVNILQYRKYLFST